MTILVTGAEGFLGRHLCKKLQDEGHIVLGHSLADGDITEPASLERYQTVDYVYHLAARTFVPDSWDFTYDYLQTNVMGTANVLELCRKLGCGVTLMSTYVYGEPQYLPVDELHPVKAATPYHQSKLMCEDLGRFYAEKFNLSVTVFRPFNIYGPGQSEAFLLPAIIRQVLDSACLEVVVMDLLPKRDYVYIDDVIAVLVKGLVLHSPGFHIFNIGSGRSVSVEDAICTVMEIVGIQKPYRSMQETRKGEVSDCVANMTRAQAELGAVDMRSVKAGLADWCLKR